MAEQDLIRFLDKVAQLQALVESLQSDPSRRDQLARCSSHNEVVALSKAWGFEIGRRWGEPNDAAQSSDNLLTQLLPAEGEESVQLLQQGASWQLKLINSNRFQSPAGTWLDQDDHEWVLLLRGSARVRLADPDRLMDLSVGDHLHLPPHQRHRVERTDPAPGTLWLALHWHDLGTSGLRA